MSLIDSLSSGDLQQANAQHDEPVDSEPGRGRHSLHRHLRPLHRSRICIAARIAVRRGMVRTYRMTFGLRNESPRYKELKF